MTTPELEQQSAHVDTELPPAKKTRDGRVIGIAILEVLAGVRTPTEAAEAIGVSLQRYYTLESRALEGLVQACEPRPRGPHSSPKRVIQGLKTEIERLEREVARHQALTRAAQRSLEIERPRPVRKKAKKVTKKGGRRKRKPTVRALKAVDRLRSSPTATSRATEPHAKT